MGFNYSDKSKQKLETCHFDLQFVGREALALGLIDIVVVHGHRGEVVQNKLFPKFSNVMWPHSKHNKVPSDAFDLAPYINGKIPWEEKDLDYWAWYFLGGVVMTAAKKLGIDIVWGRNFKVGKGDLGHFQRRTV